MALQRFSCRSCHEVAVHSDRGEAFCHRCGVRYTPNVREIAKLAATVPIALFFSFAFGQWWLILIGLALGAWLAVRADRRGSHWQLARQGSRKR